MELLLLTIKRNFNNSIYMLKQVKILDKGEMECNFSGKINIITFIFELIKLKEIMAKEWIFQ